MKICDYCRYCRFLLFLFLLRVGNYGLQSWGFRWNHLGRWNWLGCRNCHINQKREDGVPYSVRLAVPSTSTSTKDGVNRQTRMEITLTTRDCHPPVSAVECKIHLSLEGVHVIQKSIGTHQAQPNGWDDMR